jgi:hypothetical protein
MGEILKPDLRIRRSASGFRLPTSKSVRISRAEPLARFPIVDSLRSCSCADHPSSFGSRRGSELGVEGRHWYYLPKCQFEVRSIVDRWTMNTRLLSFLHHCRYVAWAHCCDRRCGEDGRDLRGRSLPHCFEGYPEDQRSANRVVLTLPLEVPPDSVNPSSATTIPTIHCDPLHYAAEAAERSCSIFIRRLPPLARHRSASLRGSAGQPSHIKHVEKGILLLSPLSDLATDVAGYALSALIAFLVLFV